MGRIARLALLALLGLLLIGPVLGDPVDAQALRRRAYLPPIPRNAALSPTCPSTGQSYALIPTTEQYSGLPAAASPDLNLSARGWVTVNQPRALVNYNGGTDPAAPQLYSLFANDRVPAFTSTYQVNSWLNGQLAPPLPSDYAVTLLGMGTAPGETLRAPRRSGSDIYQGVYWTLVVYADANRISLHYGRNDYIAPGYGVHVENVCVDPALVALYQQGNAGGRRSLPGLGNNQPFGTARGDEILVAIRDTGTFMDPRSHKDWWAGRAAASVIVDPRDHTTPR